MNSTQSRNAGAEPRSQRVAFGVSVRELRLQTRILLLRALNTAPLLALAQRFRPTGDVILCLHNVVERHGPLGVNRGLDLAVNELEAVVNYLRKEGYRPTGLEDICQQREADGQASEKRVAITFDDGYAGNLRIAYPMMRRHGLPFTVYVTTGFMDRNVRVWWYSLERLLAAVDHITFEHAGHVYAYRTVTRAQKIRAYRSVHALLLKTPPPAVDQLLVQLFEGQSCELRGLADDDLLTPEQVCTLSRDPLVTIGAHTVSHPVLRTLTDEDSRREILACRDRLEAVTGKPVRHFAYPFGNQVAFGSREEQFVRESGYATATTTRARQLMSTDRPTALPRIMLSSEFDAVATLRVLLTGWFGGRS